MSSLAGKTVAIDVSAWVHQVDQIHDAAYARTSVPPYPSLAVKMSFKAKHRALKELRITPIYVFDGKPPSNMKKNENERRGSKAATAKVQYNDLARRAVEEVRLVLPPSLTLEPVAWVAFEALDEDEMGDKYDNWVSAFFCCTALLLAIASFSPVFAAIALSICRTVTTSIN